ncbi:hypothetical protein EDD27_7169 [Nonomuraea polychroma]|uniref:Uncharacterized protein n=1 Tax=Nonomuraea polychroma TaxID=46176 RepID=A0A438MFH5_9ACTN|nr:hypothetical protein EDD27_7169 [Nonomuraea polychroma]
MLHLHRQRHPTTLRIPNRRPKPRRQRRKRPQARRQLPRRRHAPHRRLTSVDLACLPLRPRPSNRRRRTSRQPSDTPPNQPPVLQLARRHHRTINRRLAPPSNEVTLSRPNQTTTLTRSRRIMLHLHRQRHPTTLRIPNRRPKPRRQRRKRPQARRQLPRRPRSPHRRLRQGNRHLCISGSFFDTGPGRGRARQRSGGRCVRGGRDSGWRVPDGSGELRLELLRERWWGLQAFAGRIGEFVRLVQR